MKSLSTVTLIASLFSSSTWAYSFSSHGSINSSFGGSVIETWKEPVASSTIRTSTLDMKKGKDNVPPMMRANYKKQKEMKEMSGQMAEAQRPGADGLPVFNLFVRTKKANLWYPCGSFKGDDRSAALCSNYKNDGILAGISKKQIVAGVSGSLFRDLTRMKETICRTYPQLRKSKDTFEYGFKLAYEGLSDEQTKINVVEPKEQKGLIDGIKSFNPFN